MPHPPYLLWDLLRAMTPDEWEEEMAESSDGELLDACVAALADGSATIPNGPIERLVVGIRTMGLRDLLVKALLVELRLRDDRDHTEPAESNGQQKK